MIRTPIRWLSLAGSILLSGCLPTSRDTAIELCKRLIEDRLKSPASAEYPVMELEEEYLRYSGVRLTYEITGQVDAANLYGALLREDFSCFIDFYDPDAPVGRAFIGKDSRHRLREYARDLRDELRREQQKGIRSAKRADPDRLPPDVVSYAEFSKLRPGMSLARVQKIIGQDGTRESKPQALELDSRGLPVAQRVTYRWRNYDGSFVSAVFQRDKVVFLYDDGLW